MSEEKDAVRQEQPTEKKEINLEEYKDFEGVSLKKLKRGLWFVEHRRQLRLVFIGFLIFVSSVSWAYSLYGFTYYFAKGIKDDELITKQMLTSVAVGHDYISQIAPRDLQVLPTRTLKAVDKKYDFLVQIKNPNENHWATFGYHFLVNGKKVGQSEGFVLPGESKYLLSLANEFDFPPSSVKLVFENLSWQRINRHEISDWQEYYYDHMDIAIDKKEFLPAKASGLSEKLNLNDLKFEITNKTAYSYWNVDLTIVLWSGGAVAGVNKYSLTELKTMEKRSVEVSWPGILSRVDKIDVIPEINIMGKGIYMEYKADSN